MAYYSTEIKEEELKNKVADDWFEKYDTTQIVGNVDFCVSVGYNNLIWGEAKRGTTHDIYESFVQLILTIGKEKTFDDHMPPAYLCAFDAEKIAFIEYHKVMDIFSMNDFNWKVTPSDHSTTEFKVLQSRVQKVLEEENLLYYYDRNAEELKCFIRCLQQVEPQKFQISKNNFVHVYFNWLDDVKDSIGVNWSEARKNGYVDADFFLADLLSKDNATIPEKLLILLDDNHYKYKAGKGPMGDELFGSVVFKDNQKAHTTFWNKYERPPKEEYWEYIVGRRDLLVPPDVRERKGSFYTPRIWVEKSQEYLARELGENWQDEYYIWDCCAGTGNLLVGLTNPTRVFASTIDPADVNIMKQTRVGTTLLDGHIFQFDFLNDSFDKLPEKLQGIIKNEPEKLVVYINPPYAEATNAKTPAGTNKSKSGVAIEHLYNKKYKSLLGSATNELFTLFVFRIYCEIPGCIMGVFSKIKTLQSPIYKEFRNQFKANLCSLFLVPAYTFDNVVGKFPIGFHIWDTKEKRDFEEINAVVYDDKGLYKGTKRISIEKEVKYLNDWLRSFRYGKDDSKAILYCLGNDFQHQNYVHITVKESKSHYSRLYLNKDNLVAGFIYLAVRHCISATWLNDRDQYLYPKDTWKKDYEFHKDCLAYSLFHGQNRISATQGVNNFIPFEELGIGVKYAYKSHFLIDYLKGKIQRTENKQLFKKKQVKPEPVVFSAEAQAVMDCAKELYKYYHQQENANPDASFYDIRLYFQGSDQKGRMNSSSDNETYNELLKRLREAQKVLADKIAKKVYEHGFLEG